MTRRARLAASVFIVFVSTTAGVAAQLGSRPAEEWIKTLDGPQRVAALRIDDVVAALKLQPGQTVADVGAGSGLFSTPLPRAVGPKGRAFAVEIDAGVLHHVDGRDAYVKTLAGYLAPGGRVVVVDYEAGVGPHRSQPDLEVSRAQLAAMMTAAGLYEVQDVKLFSDKYFLIFARR